MVAFLDFKSASCKNCYKCLRSCPVKAIAVINHQARIIDERCILCGTCTHVCPQNAKRVHSDKQAVENLIASNKRVIASVAPSFVSSFGLNDFSVMRAALQKLGFATAEETAVGARLVVDEYERLLRGKTYDNFITSACPAVNSLIQMYYPKAIKYLAKVDSPMLAHAKNILSRDKTAEIVFIGPCIAKKKEAKNSGIVAASLTFEDLKEMFDEKGVRFDEIERDFQADGANKANKTNKANKAKYFPISSGIIKSFKSLPEGYEYVAVDGVERCMDILENIESLSGMFLELNACEYACVNGPCGLKERATALKANSDIRNYVNIDLCLGVSDEEEPKAPLDLCADYHRVSTGDMLVTERQITEILAKIGKVKAEDELNCGACGYSSCREKAWAVASGYAEPEMCLPYMRERAETMAYEIIQNSPNGVLVLDANFKIIEMNRNALKMLGIDNAEIKGCDLVDYTNPTDYILAYDSNETVVKKRIFIEKTKLFIELIIIVQKEQGVLFGFMTDVTEETSYEERLTKVRNDTIATTDEVIKKQMRVAQEIASLLGETTAETKVALLRLKKVLSEAENNKGE